MLKVMTSFSGGFGSIEFALKYENIEHEIVAACEWLDPQRKSYLHNHGEPTSSFYKDIRDLDGTRYKGEIDLYHLSPPCQSYSLAGSRGGAEDERGGLMFEAIKSIDEVQPKMFTIENVKGLLSSNGGEDWKNILRDVRSLKGYTVTWGVMNAKDQGTPQNRERVFIVGFRGKCMPMPFPKRIKLDKCLADVLEDDVIEKYYLSDKAMSGFIDIELKDKHSIHVGNSTSRGAYSGSDKIAFCLRAGNCGGVIESRKINKLGFINQDTQASAVFSPNGLSPSLCAGTHRYAQGYIKEELNQIGNIDTKGHNSLWGRVYNPDGKAPTQNAKGGGAGAKTGLFMVKSATKDGYETAQQGDSINLTFPNSKTRRGRVGKSVPQTLDTACNQGVIEPIINVIGNIYPSNHNAGDIFSKKGIVGVLTCSGPRPSVKNVAPKIEENHKIRRLTPRECSRVQGDFQDMFKQGEASDTKLYEFIGNAMDISTTRNLLKAMFSHKVEFSEPLEPSFVRKEMVNNTLF